MSLRVTFSKRIFKFNFKARTSRGLMRDKTSWFLQMEDDTAPGISGFGECGPLPGLSVDSREDYEECLLDVVQKMNAASFTPADAGDILAIIPPEFPSIKFVT